MITPFDGAENILARCEPLHIGTLDIAFVDVQMIDLHALLAAARHEGLRDESVNAYTSLKFEVTQFDV